jgi:hypothetical protein
MPASAQFSVAEVDALLPQLEQVFVRLDELQTEIGARANELQRLGYGTQSSDPKNEPEPVQERRLILGARRQMLEAELEKIAALGGLLLDLELAIVAFPSRREGQDVYLSWQRGDESVRYFHRPDDHFIHGRRPI